jgi:hypothetical protein
MVMITRVVPFTALVAQARWKVEFFVSEHAGAKSTAYPLVRLKDVLANRREFLDPQKFPDHLFHYLGLEHVQPLTGDLTDGYQPGRGRAVLSRCKVFRRGDILYGRLRPSLNKVFVADGMISEGICSGEFYVLTPATRAILPHFARALLASRYVQDVVRTMTSGSALPRLGLDDLLEIEIPLPPLPVQREYEASLIARNAERQRLTAELRDGPAADLEALVAALEEGGEITFGRTPPAARLDFGEIALPDDAVLPARGRGRPKGKQKGLFTEAP